MEPVKRMLGGRAYTAYFVGMITTLILVSCAGAAFPYKYYGLDAQSYDGWLRGDKPEADLKLSECTPTDSDKAPCMVVKTAVMLKLKLEYSDMQNRLRQCEQPRTGD